MLTKNEKVFKLIKDISEIIKSTRYNTFRLVNTEMLKSYFLIGKLIVEEEQKGKKRADYGKKLINSISLELTKQFNKGFDVSNIRRIRRFYLVYQKWETVSPKLTWSHYSELIKIKDSVKRKYFEEYAVNENLSVRDLKRQIYSLHYERLIINNTPLQFKSNKNKIENFIKDPYILDFLDINENPEFNELYLETQILNKLQKFLLELGKGFCFVARQKRISIDNDNFYIDLLFYNIYLKRYIVIEIKTDKFKHEYIGQLNFYLNYVKTELNKKEDKDPIGLLLCTEKDNLQVKYALGGIKNKLFVSKYQLYLPTKEELKKIID
jgi:predicted nuclease of restriction endonuclease-like (RecB) superfamily